MIGGLLLLLGSADLWRLISAAVAVFVLFALVVALVAYGSELLPAWRRVIALVAAQQVALAYAAVVRAVATPAGFPEEHVDVALLAIAVSAIGLAVSVVGVFAGRRVRRAA